MKKRSCTKLFGSNTSKRKYKSKKKHEAAHKAYAEKVLEVFGREEMGRNNKNLIMIYSSW